MSKNENVYRLAYEAALAIAEAAEQEPEITFPIEGFVVTGKRTLWSQVVRSGHKPAPQEDVRLWVRPWLKLEFGSLVIVAIRPIAAEPFEAIGKLRRRGEGMAGVLLLDFPPGFGKRWIVMEDCIKALHVKAHVFRSTYGRPMCLGQDTIWVACSCDWCPKGWEPHTRYSGDPEEIPFRTYHDVNGEWQVSHDRQFGIMEGDALAEACPATRAFLTEIGCEKDYVAEDDVEGFLTFLDNLEAHVAEWELEDHDEDEK